jgi:hypothetical protein
MLLEWKIREEEILRAFESNVVTRKGDNWG